MYLGQLSSHNLHKLHTKIRRSLSDDNIVALKNNFYPVSAYRHTLGDSANCLLCSIVPAFRFLVSERYTPSGVLPKRLPPAIAR